MAFMSVLLMLIASPIMIIVYLIELLFTDPQMLIETLDKVGYEYLADVLDKIFSIF